MSIDQDLKQSLSSSTLIVELETIKAEIYISIFKATDILYCFLSLLQFIITIMNKFNYNNDEQIQQ